MINLDLNAGEIKILKEILNNDLSDLRMEIAHTDSRDFKEELKNHKTVIKKVLEALE